ncbi:MAG: ribose-phosphate pyrophosphokinase, partial [Bacteroidaceae bacterium]|nr:ribose-phosphate pyrophosphokinase [Bacteroidaceae bacterium]
VTNSKMTELIFSDSIPFTKDCPKAHIISIAEMFAETIRRAHNNESISSQYIM